MVPAILRPALRRRHPDGEPTAVSLGLLRRPAATGRSAPGCGVSGAGARHHRRASSGRRTRASCRWHAAGTAGCTRHRLRPGQPGDEPRRAATWTSRLYAGDCAQPRLCRPPRRSTSPWKAVSVEGLLLAVTGMALAFPARPGRRGLEDCWSAQRSPADRSARDWFVVQRLKRVARRFRVIATPSLAPYARDWTRSVVVKTRPGKRERARAALRGLKTVRVVDVPAGHRDAERPERVLDADRVAVRGEHVRQALIDTSALSVLLPNSTMPCSRRRLGIPPRASR